MNFSVASRRLQVKTTCSYIALLSLSINVIYEFINPYYEAISTYEVAYIYKLRYLSQVTYVFMQSCRVGIPENVAW